MQKNKIIGYTCGSFDLFHIGHLNILKQAKKQCDYLIVGVNSDETMYRCKNKWPVISFDERRQILEAIKYVDKVIKVECAGPGQKADDWQQRLDADVVFSGDDHVNGNEWLELQRYKKQHGGKVVFFPYTNTTSSTLIRKILEDRVRS